MTKVIIFDLGGVLIPEKWDFIKGEIAKELKVSSEEFSELMKGFEDDLRKGKIGLIDVYREIVGKLGYGDADRLLEIHFSLYKEYQSHIDERVLDLVKKLKENYKVVSLTNTERDITDYNKKRGLFDHFHGSYISCDMGCKKPGEEIYRRMLQDLGVDADETLFIDNDTNYIEGAEKVGIPCILFVGYEELVEELKNIGIRF